MASAHASSDCEPTVFGPSASFTYPENVLMISAPITDAPWYLGGSR